MFTIIHMLPDDHHTITGRLIPTFAAGNQSPVETRELFTI